MRVFIRGGVSTMEPWTLGMVGWGGGGIGLSENKRFLPSMHDDRTIPLGETIIATIKII
jgi:hypothetical protein